MSGKKELKLPGWFSLKKYEDAANFLLIDWLRAFEFRTHTALLLDILKSEKESAKTMRKAARTELKLRGRFMLVEDMGGNAHRAYSYRHYEDDMEAPVSNLDVIDIYEITDVIKGATPSIYQVAYEKFSEELKSGGTAIYADSPLAEAVHDALDPDCFPIHKVAFAKINLQASDSTIIDNFSQWLKKCALSISTLKGEEKGNIHRKMRQNGFMPAFCLTWIFVYGRNMRMSICLIGSLGMPFFLLNAK